MLLRTVRCNSTARATQMSDFVARDAKTRGHSVECRTWTCVCVCAGVSDGTATDLPKNSLMRAYLFFCLHTSDKEQEDIADVASTSAAEGKHYPLRNEQKEYRKR